MTAEDYAAIAAEIASLPPLTIGQMDALAVLFGRTPVGVPASEVA